MSGKIDFIKYVILAVALFASVTDLKWGKIFNWFTLSTSILGFALSTLLLGWSGLLVAVLGFLAGFCLYGWLFALRFMGGGDVKFLMALGALGGFHFAQEVAILAILIGGVFSFLILTFTGKIVDFMKRIYIFFLSIFVKELEFQLPKIDRTLTLPFGIPISIAAVWVAFLHPFNQWGIALWP